MPTPNDDARPFRILVVDDDEAIRGFVERALRQTGHDIRVAVDGADALRLAVLDGPFDLLLTDLAMPSMRGDELARRLRHTDPSLKVLYLTGYSDRLFEGRSVLWDAEAFLDKPVTVKGLLEAVSLLLVGRIPAPRAARVRIPGARVRLGDAVANLETLSVTGALIKVGKDVAVGSTWPLVLHLSDETLSLTARVVSCEPAEPSACQVAVTFVEPSPALRRALQRACDGIVTAEASAGADRDAPRQ